LVLLKENLTPVSLSSYGRAPLGICIIFWRGGCSGNKTRASCKVERVSTPPSSVWLSLVWI